MTHGLVPTSGQHSFEGATGKRFETPKVDVWRFRDGRVISFFEYYDTAKVGAAAP